MRDSGIKHQQSQAPTRDLFPPRCSALGSPESRRRGHSALRGASGANAWSPCALKGSVCRGSSRQGTHPEQVLGSDGWSLEKWGEAGTDRRGSGTGTCLPSTAVWIQVCRLALSRGVGGACQPGLTCAKGSRHLSLMAVSGSGVWPGLLRRSEGGRVRGHRPADFAGTSSGPVDPCVCHCITNTCKDWLRAGVGLV